MQPNYEATAAEYAQYGGNLNIWQQIQLLSAWSPLIGFVQRFVGEADPFKRSLIAVEGMEWVASKTQATLDDELVKHVTAMARTPEGEAFARWFLAKVQGAK